MTTDRVDFARQSFAANRGIAEKSLATIKQHAHLLHDFRHGRTTAGPIRKILLWLPYLCEKSRVVPLLKETRWKIRFYRKVEADLERGDLASAIEALSLFAPLEETTLETIQRVRTSPVTVWAIQRSPHIVRLNMLRLRDDLIKVQQEKAV
jgi:hypothetical protein